MQSARVTLLCTLVLTASVAGAQGGALNKTTPADRARMQTAMMKTQLDLKEDQVPKVSAINEKYAAKMDPVLKASEAPAVRTQKAKELGEQKDVELKAVLTPEQYAKYVAWQQELRAKMTEQHEKRREAAGGAGK